jgi:hypothetical protein
MKTKNILLQIIFLTIAFTSCKKTNVSCDFIQDKIIRYDCDRVIVQLQSTKLIGDSMWTDVKSGKEYENIVSLFNTCKIAELTRGELKTIYFKPDISNQSDNTPCSQCLAISQNPPKTYIRFTEISLSPCENQ